MKHYRLKIDCPEMQVPDHTSNEDLAAEALHRDPPPSVPKPPRSQPTAKDAANDKKPALVEDDDDGDDGDDDDAAPAKSASTDDADDRVSDRVSRIKPRSARKSS